jgi:tRNA-dihydrouridine synthase B
MDLYLAPLNSLGNCAFRKLCFINGADYLFTEMIRCEKLSKGIQVELKKANIPQSMENNTIAQIICEKELVSIKKAIQVLLNINPNLKEINYNMGCPQSTLCKDQNGAGILKNIEKLKQTAKAFSASCQEYNLIPSVKTRIGTSRDNINIKKILEVLIDCNITKIYLHGRVLGESYNSQATYDEIKQIKQLFPQIELIGNGDVTDLESYENLKQTGVDGIMIGRGALENPKLFNILKEKQLDDSNKSGIDYSLRKDLIIKFLKYAKLAKLTNSQIKSNLSYLTKNITKGAKLRDQINNINDTDELINFLNNYN